MRGAVAPRARAARHRARRRTAGAVVVGLVAAGLGYAAVASDGSTVHEAVLDDAGVWVSSAAQAKLAKANVPVGQLDAGVATDLAAGSGLDVLQDGAVVLGLAADTGELFPLDARTSAAGDPVASVAPGPRRTGFAPRPVDLRGGTLALLDPASGKVYAQRVDDEAGTDSFPGLATGADPVATIGKDGALAVGLDGVVHAVSGATGVVTSVGPLGEGFGPPVEVATGLRTGRPDVTAVGADWVAYDVSADRLYTAGSTDGFDAQTTVDDDRQAVLQQPGPDADTVVVESATHAALVPLDGGDRPGGVVVGERVDRVPGATLLARPVVLDGCVHAAWAEQGQVFYGANCGRTTDEPTATLPADGSEPTRDGVAFRVNRGLVVLNDLDNGGVWDLEDKPTKIDDWDALTPPTRRDDDNEKKDENLLDDARAEQPPKAVPDAESVRPGRTSTLHVLDNDTDVAGSVLAIDQADVSAPNLDGVTATVSADGQSIDVSVPEDTENRRFDFTYKVNNGKTTSKAAARVSVRVVPDSVNGPPHLRPGGAKLAEQTYPVIAGKRLSVPVLADWRDPENDVLAARADRPGSIVDGAGRITLTAPTEVGRRPIPYVVTDGRGGSTEGTVSAQVVGTNGDSRLVAPRTQPDAVRGVVGKPLQVEPLGNDIAGADPGEPDATLALRSDVRPVGPLQVDTDLATGTVTVTGNTAGTFELTYSATTGAGAAAGRIRVDLTPPPDGAPPVSVPDTATLHDQSPAMVDVLANDYSPRGDVLVTASVSADEDTSWVRPSIYQGRWVRLEATQPAPSGETGRQGVVHYTVSDGTQRVTGEVSVVQQGSLEDALPIVVDDEATVREGDTVSIPVLDNDTMADGIPLELDPGSVEVVSKGDAQRAFASGNVVRYVPEARGLTAAKFVTIEYAAYAEGAKERAGSARVRVQVDPLPSAQNVNRAPVARSFTATVTAGDPITITVPTFGVDPDGDSVTLTGVVGSDGGPVDLTYGRVTTIGPSTITYESYPLAAGTEVITYEVTDRFGARSRAFVRVGVVQPGDPQPPVAVDDEVFAAPGKTVTVRPLVNDLIARGDVVDVDTESLNDRDTRTAWQVDEDHTVRTEVPSDTTRLHQLVYGISDGLFDPSRASILVRPVPGYVNPPVANDDVARPKPGERSTVVDVLANDTDVDSDPRTLRVVDVLSSDAQVTGDGRVSVRILDHPYAVPYVIEDEDGARAMALVHVPTGANGQPFVVEGALVEMDPDSTRTVPLADVVKSPRDRAVSVTKAATLSASPAADLSATLVDNHTLELTSSNGYVGPAAVMVEVTDQTEVDQADVGTAYVSIPVQVGPEVPLLRCPDGAVTVTAGGLDRTVDIPTFCHAWLPVGMTLDDVDFDTRWETEPDADLSVGGTGGRELTLHADPDATSGTGTLAVTSPGLAEPSRIAVRVVGSDGGTAADPLPPPTVRPVDVSGLEEGASRTVDIRPYLDSPLPDPQCTVLTATVESGDGLTARASGCAVALTVGDRPSPTASVGVVVSDGPGRQAPGRITVAMLGRPSVPRGVGAVADRDAGRQARVSWLPPEYDGGSVVTSYVVRWTGGTSGESTCRATPCTVTGLTNGEDYRFTVAAVNGVGEGEPSPPTAPVRPDTLPDAVTGVRMTDRGDGSLTIAWDEPSDEGSALTKYVVRLVSSTGSTKTQDVAAPTRAATVTGLDNMAEQDVQVQAWNDLGAGPFGPAVTMQSAGTPPALAAPDIAASGPGPAQDSATLTVSWEQGSPNGPPTTGYTLYQRAEGAVTQVTTTPPDVRSADVVIPYDGRTYEYAVTLTNGADIEGPKSTWSGFTSVGQPSTPSVTAKVPAADGRVVLEVAVGRPRGGSFTAIRWSGAGQSGTYDCSGRCAPDTTVPVTTSAYPTLDTTESNAQRWTAWTVNDGGQESVHQTSGESVWPYRATRTPTNGRTSANGTRITYSWGWSTDGRSATGFEVRRGGSVLASLGPNQRSWTNDEGAYAVTRSVTVVAVAQTTGRSSGLTITGRTDDPPPPEIYNVHKGPGYIPPNGSGSCAYSACPRVDWDVRNFPGNTSWTVTVFSRSGSYTSTVKFVTNADGTGTTGEYGNTSNWRSTGIVVASGNGPVSVRLCRNGTCYRSGNVAW